MKTDGSYFAGKSGVLYSRTTIQRQEWTPFILGAEDLKKTKQNLSDLQEKKSWKPAFSVSFHCLKRCLRSLRSARCPAAATPDVQSHHKHVCPWTRQWIYNVANRPGLPRSPTHWAPSVAPRFNTGFQTLRTPKKKKSEIPLLHASFNATFQNVIRGKRGATLWSSFPCRPETARYQRRQSRSGGDTRGP